MYALVLGGGEYVGKDVLHELHNMELRMARREARARLSSVGFIDVVVAVIAGNGIYSLGAALFERLAG